MVRAGILERIDKKDVQKRIEMAFRGIDRGRIAQLLDQGMWLRMSRWMEGPLRCYSFSGWTDRLRKLSGIRGALFVSTLKVASNALLTCARLQQDKSQHCFCNDGIDDLRHISRCINVNCAVKNVLHALGYGEFILGCGLLDWNAILLLAELDRDRIIVAGTVCEILNHTHNYCRAKKLRLNVDELERCLRARIRYWRTTRSAVGRVLTRRIAIG